MHKGNIGKSTKVSSWLIPLKMRQYLYLLKIIVHFYHNDFLRCKIMDKHLKDIAIEHPECLFVSINA